MSLAHLMHVLLAPDEEEAVEAPPAAPATPSSDSGGGGGGVGEQATGQLRREAEQRDAEARDRAAAKAEAAAQHADEVAREDAWHKREEGHWAEEAARGGATAPADVAPAAPLPAEAAQVGGVVPHDWQGNVRIGGVGGSGEVHPGVQYAKAPIRRKAA